MGKLTISIAIFNSYVRHNQRVHRFFPDQLDWPTRRTSRRSNPLHYLKVHRKNGWNLWNYGVIFRTIINDHPGNMFLSTLGPRFFFDSCSNPQTDRKARCHYNIGFNLSIFFFGVAIWSIQKKHMWILLGRVTSPNFETDPYSPKVWVVLWVTDVSKGTNKTNPEN